MAVRTIVESVERHDSPPENLEALEAELSRLRARHPGAIIHRYLGQVPKLADDAFVAEGAALIGDVRLAEKTSVWFGCVLRADINTIEVREMSNIQDGAVIHLGDEDPTFIAEEVVVGHRAVLHGCHIGAGSLIGIGAIVLDGAEIGEGSVVGSGALVTAGREIPPHSLVLGAPGKVIKTLSAEDEAFHRKLAQKYVRLTHNYQHG
jgi:carbonic anhydrase/acetyltransferase-like protein (isoleucine patch superfamily)